MGVSIRGYGSITHLPDYSSSLGDNEEPPDDVFRAYVLRPFAHALDGLLGQDHTFSHSCVGGEWYLVGNPAPGHGVSMDYDGYGRFRNALSVGSFGVPAKQVWVDAERHAGEPYLDLVHFADNEGVLGPVACRRLADAFRDHPVDFGDPCYNTSRDSLAVMFEHAADTGMVVFR